MVWSSWMVATGAWSVAVWPGERRCCAAQVVIEHRTRPHFIPVVVLGINPEDRDRGHPVFTGHLVGKLECGERLEQGEKWTAEKPRLLPGEDGDGAARPPASGWTRVRARGRRGGLAEPASIWAIWSRRRVCAWVRRMASAQAAFWVGSPEKNGSTAAKIVRVVGRQAPDPGEAAHVDGHARGRLAGRVPEAGTNQLSSASPGTYCNTAKRLNRKSFQCYHRTLSLEEYSRCTRTLPALRLLTPSVPSVFSTRLAPASSAPSFARISRTQVDWSPSSSSGSTFPPNRPAVRRRTRPSDRCRPYTSWHRRAVGRRAAPTPCRTSPRISSPPNRSTS